MEEIHTFSFHKTLGDISYIHHAQANFNFHNTMRDSSVFIKQNDAVQTFSCQNQIWGEGGEGCWECTFIFSASKLYEVSFDKKIKCYHSELTYKCPSFY